MRNPKAEFVLPVFPPLPPPPPEPPPEPPPSPELLAMAVMVTVLLGRNVSAVAEIVNESVDVARISTCPFMLVEVASTPDKNAFGTGSYAKSYGLNPMSVAVVVLPTTGVVVETERMRGFRSMVTRRFSFAVSTC